MSKDKTGINYKDAAEKIQVAGMIKLPDEILPEEPQAELPKEAHRPAESETVVEDDYHFRLYLHVERMLSSVSRSVARAIIRTYLSFNDSEFSLTFKGDDTVVTDVVQCQSSR